MIIAQLPVQESENIQVVVDVHPDIITMKNHVLVKDVHMNVPNVQELLTTVLFVQELEEKDQMMDYVLAHTVISMMDKMPNVSLVLINVQNVISMDVLVVPKTESVQKKDVLVI